MNQWKTINLGEAATFINGYAFKPSDWSDEGKEIIRIQNLTGSSSEVNYFTGQIDPRYKVVKGDLLISWSATLGIYEWEGEESWLNQHIFKVVFDKETVGKSFFKHLIAHSLRKMEEQVHGATMKHITKKKFDSIQIPLPPLPVQQKIAAILDAADLHRQKTKTLIEKYDQLTQSIFLEMFGDPVRNEKGWEIESLRELCSIITDGTHFSPEPQKTGFPYVTAKHVKAHGLDFDSNPTFISEEAHNQIYKRCTPEFGDVLYIKDGATTGIACLNTFNEPISLLSSLALLKPLPEKLNNHYLCFWLNNENIRKKLISEFMSGAAIQRFTLKKINVFKINVPPISLQNQFAERIIAIDKQKKQAREVFSKSKELFNTLLQRAFKGELVN
jgi:type I restriction enzyme, S subunit